MVSKIDLCARSFYLAPPFCKGLDPPLPLQHSASTPSHQYQPFFPRQQQCLSPPVVHRPAVPHSQMLQLKKLISNEKAPPSGAIEEALSAADDVIACYTNLKGSKLPTLAMKLAKEAFFGEKIMKQCTPLGGRELPSIPTAELSKLKEVLYSHAPQYWTNIAEYESAWTDCINCFHWTSM